MSLHPHPIPPVPDETARVARAVSARIGGRDWGRNMVTLLTLDSERQLPYQAPADCASDIKPADEPLDSRHRQRAGWGAGGATPHASWLADRLLRSFRAAGSGPGQRALDPAQVALAGPRKREFRAPSPLVAPMKQAARNERKNRSEATPARGGNKAPVRPLRRTRARPRVPGVTRAAAPLRLS